MQSVWHLQPPMESHEHISGASVLPEVGEKPAKSLLSQPLLETVGVFHVGTTGKMFFSWLHFRHHDHPYRFVAMLHRNSQLKIPRACTYITRPMTHQVAWRRRNVLQWQTANSRSRKRGLSFCSLMSCSHWAWRPHIVEQLSASQSHHVLPENQGFSK